MPTTSALPAFKIAMYNAATTLVAGQAVDVDYNRHVFDRFSDAMVIGLGSSESEPATIGPRRQREETLELEVIIYAFVAGGQEAEALADARAYQLLGLLEEYVRATDTNLAGTVRDCFLTKHGAGPATGDNLLAQGRMTVIPATFTAHARISS